MPAKGGYAGAARERRLQKLEGAEADLSLRDVFGEELAIARRKGSGSGEVPFLEWALRCPEPKTGTLDFDRFPFQRRMYEDGAIAREEVMVKSTQVGASARNARKGLYQADQRGLTTLYVFPTKGDVYDFSDARITPMVERSEYLRSRLRPDSVFNKGLKKIGLGFFYLRGSEKKTALDSVDADCLILDEYDTLRRENIPDAERRISGSEHGSITRLGVPSYPSSGIWQHFEKTDKRKWLVKCEACNDWQELNFFKNVDFEKATRICARCGRELDVRRGQWVAEFPDREVIGWHVPRLIVPNCDVRAMIAASLLKDPHLVQVFHNKDLGLPYAGGENRLTEAMLKACWREFTMEPFGYGGANPVTMGIDVASVRALNVRISELLPDGFKRALWIGTVDSLDDLVPLMDRFRVNMAAIDRAPERRLAEAFANLFPGRVYLVGYATNQRQSFAVDQEMRMASVRPVEAFDATLELVRAQRNLLPIDWPADYVEHMQSPVRTAPIKNALGVEEVEYIFNGPSDYFHAEVYDVVAEMLWYVRQEVEAAQRTHLWALEDQLEGFTRSDLAASGWEEQEYRPGPGDGEYRPGPGD